MTATATRLREPLMAIALGGITSMGTGADASALDYLIEGEARWAERAGLWSDVGTRRPAPVTASGLFELGLFAPTVSMTTSLSDVTLAGPETAQRDQILKELRKLRIMERAGAPKDGALSVLASIDDAIAVVQAWPSDVPAPYLDVDDDGRVSLDVLQEDGLAVAGLDFLGIEHVAAFSIVDGNLVVGSGKLKTTSTTEVIQFFNKLISAVA